MRNFFRGYCFVKISNIILSTILIFYKRINLWIVFILTDGGQIYLFLILT